MATENVYWMATGPAYWLGRNPHPRTGVAPHKVPIVEVNKKTAANTNFTGETIWIGRYLCAVFKHLETGNMYAQIIAEEAA